MALIKSDILFKVCGAKSVGKQKVKVKPVEHHYEEDGEPEYIKYGCPLCESLGNEYRKFYSYSSGLFDKDKQFNQFSFSKGTPNCPICGINIDWDYKSLLEKSREIDDMEVW